MLEIDKTLVSDHLIEKKFVCNLEKCKGKCCVMGDAGAPVSKEEALILDNIYEKIKPYLRPEGIEAIEKNGKYYLDSDYDTVTQLVDGKECAYTIFSENGIAFCAIEKAFEAGIVDFRKPISCYLYPVRTKKYNDFESVNYDCWNICNSALINGEELDVPLYKFLEAPLTQNFGKQWFETLKFYAENYKRNEKRR